jgi:hypothetical protein
MRQKNMGITLLAGLTVALAACAAPADPATLTNVPATTPPEPTAMPVTASPDTPVSSTPGDGPPPQTPPYAPAPGDAQFDRGNAFVDSAEIIVAESFPPQYFLSLRGSLPTPCHTLRVAVSPPAAGNRIDVDVYSITDPNTMCAQVLEPFEVNVRLGTYPAGTYEVWVNGQPVGEFQAP